MRTLWLTIVIIFLFSGCKDEDPDPVVEDDPIDLVANAGIDQEVKRNTEVILDGSATTGPDISFEYEWVFKEGPEELTQDDLGLTNETEEMASFIPPLRGLYIFELQVSAEDQISSDEVTITVTGSIDIGGRLSESMFLDNIEEGTSPDYEITSDLIIPEGLSVTLGESSITVSAKEGVGIIIESGAFLQEDSNEEIIDTRFTSENGWKGILIQDNAYLKLSEAVIENAGHFTFEGKEEAGSLVVEDFGTLQLSDILFEESGSYDILGPEEFSTSGLSKENFRNITFSSSKPIKAYIGILYFLDVVESFNYPENLEYIELTTLDGEGFDVLPFSEKFVFQSAPYVIHGDFVTKTNVEIMEGAQIWFEENKGLLQFEGSLSIMGTETNPVIIDGIDGNGWKGIGGNFGTSLTIEYAIIRNAGSETFSYNDGFDTYQSDYKAALNGVNDVINSEIINSKGYGIIPGQTSGVLNILNTTIENSVLAGLLAYSASTPLMDNHANEFIMNENTAAVEYVGDFLPFFSETFSYPLLGGNNYYLFNGLEINSNFEIHPGSVFKFTSGSVINQKAGNFTAEGTSENPIVIDGQIGNPGSWFGMILQGEHYSIEHCEIYNAGEDIIPIASEKANVIFRSNGQDLKFSNNIISGSNGYGVVVESGFINPLDNTNTFSDNESGSVLIK